LDDSTAILAVGHVFFTTGWAHDLLELAERAHSAGALMIVDAWRNII